jgi:hypothetical protein
LYHLGLNVIIRYESLSSGTNVIIWDYMLSSGMQCYHLEVMLSSGTKCSSGANVIMVSSGANVIIWCYHVMLSSGMITHPFFIFPENFTHSEIDDASNIAEKMVWQKIANSKYL